MAKVKLSKYEPDYDITPQAIFWRALKYFTTMIREGEDGLDEFQAASFTIGNDIRFDLRTYAGHPEFTVTLYLPNDVKDKEEISRVIKIVIKEMVIPKNAIAWQRGEPFTYGDLKRPRGDRLREPEARILALKIAAQQPNRTASTQFIKREVPKYTELSEVDRRRSPSRGNEALWQQIVGNVISHQETPAGPFKKGYATRTLNGLSVTEKGMAYLNSMGFLASFTPLAE
ncbi:hypothetical protein [Siccirubricoccus sp. G192]|uniref:hypothetical protein n=1 Tax=Siccirubricoccus sp. G192 TaxID=2849651 RepID=UPI001C2C87E6|nr:hypothetical protein [Siccirubricoccus sp. G192]MBV1799821.1 hypothetical protein [Siccirubricoccus sp. G192]